MALQDRYEIVRHLGEGASGEVCLARDRVQGGREVALKTLRVRVDDLLRAAFEREFATMASLSIPGIAQVYDFGVTSERLGHVRSPFFTRAFIDGQPFDRAVRGRGLEERLQAFVRVCRVIAPLHRAGVIHGDLKPGNVIVDAQGEPWLIDFGLARAMNAHAQAHGPAGTLPFMAPELLRGEQASISSEIYALGVTLHWLVTFEHPHEQLGARALAAKLEGKLPEIPVLASALERSTLEIARRALARNPLDRHPNVDELIVSVARLAGGERASVLPGPTAFVPPRPRGHAPLLASLEGGIAKAERSSVWFLSAPVGGGKSLLLRELKWRLQLRSCLVLEVFAGRTDAALSLLSLLEQLVSALGAERKSVGLALERAVELRAGRLDELRLSETLGALLADVASEAQVVILADDLDRADAVLGSVLRSSIHFDEARAIVVVAAGESATSGAARELPADRTLSLPTLSSEDVAALATDALGPLDSSVLDALCEHAQGLPGALVSALYELSKNTAVTAADVQQLAPSAVARAYANARLERVKKEDRTALQVMALLSTSAEQRAVRLLSTLEPIGEAAAGAVFARLESQALVVRDAGVLMLADSALRKSLLAELGEAGQCELAERLLDCPLESELDLLVRARLCVLARRWQEARILVPEAVRKASAAGAHALAARLLRALVPQLEGQERREACLQLARVELTLGEDEDAASLARELSSDAQASTSERFESAILSARALTSLGRFDEAVAALGQVPDAAAASSRARVQRELAKVHLRRGDYDAVARAVELGLEHAAHDDPVRIELLCSKGMVASYRSRHSEARACHEEALAVARAHGEPRDQANVLTYMAIGAQRVGNMSEARDLLTQSLEIARGIGDVGSMATYAMNLGAVLYYLGEPGSAEEHYESAARLARRAGRQSTYAQARNNLAHVHLYFGLYERARVEIEEVLRDARAAGHKFIAAQATALQADWLAKTGELEKALIQYDDAIARYHQLGQTREVAEHHLDAAEALLDRGGPVDASAAAARLSTAREQIERERLEDLRLRMELLVARARVASGDTEAAIVALGQVLERAQRTRDHEIEWSALAALCKAHEMLGATFAARRHARLSLEVLESIALRVPREHREAFWQDPRRRAVRARALEQDGAELSPASDGRAQPSASTDERARLLEILKRLASEHELDRLLERIIESAVDLSGAERGSVLLLGDAGQLIPHVTRLRTSAQDEAHTAFSRSIAEAVLIDGEPIVTVDASVDGRLSSYVSVHKLMLRSVACLPIRGRTGTLGVLYLEHRRSRGRFDEAAVDLLCAFADQAAIALENARLLAEVRSQKEELEHKNRELAEAKAELEDALLVRTRQLDDVQRELSRATQKTSGELRHGMVGRTPSMARVFDAIDRLAAATVSVVIRGESGTGKELVARAIHYAGPRAKAPFVAINCGSMPESLLESELFGHVRGAFSGADRDRKGLIAAASGGTLFLDEVSDMPPKMQVGLLRVLQEGKVCRVGSEVDEAVDVRVVAATQRPLAQLVAEGKFREDLYYRLSVVELTLPALRERREDIPLLCDHFLRAFAQREALPRKQLTRAALTLLMEQPWPGNVRQLEHVLLQACVMVDAAQIEAEALGLGVPAAPPRRTPREAADPGLPRVETLEDHRSDEKQRILAALEACGWNRVRAARALGMPRRTFYRRLADYSIL